MGKERDDIEVAATIVDRIWERGFSEKLGSLICGFTSGFPRKFVKICIFSKPFLHHFLPAPSSLFNLRWTYGQE